MTKESKLSLAGTLAGTLLFLLAFIVVMCSPHTVSAQGVLVWFSLSDVAGNSAAQALSATGQTARTCQLTAPLTNAANVRWGDSAITASRGSLIAPGGGQFLPPGGVGSAYTIDLTTTYVYVVTGDKLSVTCAK